MIAGAARASSDSHPVHLGPLGWTLAFTLSVLMFMLTGCSSRNFTPAPVSSTSYYAPSRQSYGTSRTEVASWYGPGFAGHPTSSGEIYNPEGLTAASKTLPLGSHVRVTNPDTGRSVVVRINVRGPYVRGRSLDLSHGAARRRSCARKGRGRSTQLFRMEVTLQSLQIASQLSRALGPQIAILLQRLVDHSF